MTQFRIIGNGHRRQLGNGAIRAIRAQGSRYFDVAGSTSLGVAAGGATQRLVPMVGQTWLSFAVSGSLTPAGTIGRITLSFGLAGALSGIVNLGGAALVGFNLLASLTPGRSARGTTSVDFTAGGRLVRGASIQGRVGLGLDNIGQLALSAALRGRIRIGLRVKGALTAKAGQKWRDLWRDAYEKRQALLNAIDANNRDLAKEAELLAGANATAIVQTNTRVDLVDGKVTAEAQRVTVLTGKVTNIEGTQTAQGTAISNLQTTQTSQAGTLTSHSQQLVNVQSSITTLDGKVTVNANATTALDARVSVNELGVAQAKATWGVYLTAGNVISGVQSINNGIVAEFNVMAHIFRIMSPAGADGTEYRDGYLRVWRNGFQKIIGNGFGANGDLMEWFGPNIGVGACTPANCIECKTTSGTTIIRGAVSGSGSLEITNTLLTLKDAGGVVRSRWGMW